MTYAKSRLMKRTKALLAIMVITAISVPLMLILHRKTDMRDNSIMQTVATKIPGKMNTMTVTDWIRTGTNVNVYEIPDSEKWTEFDNTIIVRNLDPQQTYVIVSTIRTEEGDEIISEGHALIRHTKEGLVHVNHEIDKKYLGHAYKCVDNVYRIKTGTGK